MENIKFYLVCFLEIIFECRFYFLGAFIGYSIGGIIIFFLTSTNIKH